MSSAHGVDTSGPLDPYAWQKAGNLFAIVKATEGTGYIAPTFAENWADLRLARMGRGAYHYARPDSNPAAQAAHFVSTVRAAGMHPGEVLALDLEETGGRPPVEVSFWAYVFLRECERLAPEAQVKVYTYPAFAEAGNCAKLGSWPLWLAHWGVPSPVVPLPWKTWRIWQYAAGTEGSPDLDVFNGTLEQAEEFFHLTSRM